MYVSYDLPLVDQQQRIVRRHGPASLSKHTPGAGARYGCQPFLHEVSAGVQGNANEKGVSTHSPSQEGLGCSGSPRGTRKRKPVKPGEPALGEGPFIFDMFSQLAAAAEAASPRRLDAARVAGPDEAPVEEEGKLFLPANP